MDLPNTDRCALSAEVIGAFGSFCMCIILTLEVSNLLINTDDFRKFQISCTGAFGKTNKYFTDHKSRNKVKPCKHRQPTPTD